MEKLIVNTSSESFREWYMNTPYSKIKALRLLIIKECKLVITKKGRCAVFENWITGLTEVPPLAQDVLNKIAGKQLNYSIKKAA